MATHEEETAAVVAAAQAVAKTIGPWTDCPHCGANKSHQEVRNYDLIWGDGDVYCCSCGGYVRSWDRD